MNRVCLMGRIGRDLELKKTNSGVSVVSFPLAVDRNGKEGGTDWIDVVAWRGTAEVLCNYADKGRMIGIEGRLQMRDWTDKDGNKRRSAEVVADNLYFGDSRRDNGGEGGSYTGGNSGYSAPAGGYAAPVGGASGFAEIDEEDGDLPF